MLASVMTLFDGQYKRWDIFCGAKFFLNLSYDFSIFLRYLTDFLQKNVVGLRVFEKKYGLKATPS